MRLQILSDLHLEFGPAGIPVTQADVVVLAGDIHVGYAGPRWAREHFADKPVVYVLGNHEFYMQSLPEFTELLRGEASGGPVYLLENSVVEIAGYTFLGCTLWTDFQLSPDPDAAMRVAEKYMSDYHVIDFSPEKRVLRARDTVRWHAESVAWLRSALAKYDRARTIVVTHHAPSPRSEGPDHTGSPLQPAFVSDLNSLIEQSGVPLWIHGHTHYNLDYALGSTRVVTNQRGYPDELCKGFDASLMIEV